MSDETRKLLGGYATGTLTPEEKDRLFAEALHDQELFEALHDEEGLRQVLEDPVARRQVLEATETPEFTIAGGLREWWDRPRGKVLAAALGVAAIMVSVRIWQDTPRDRYREAQSAQAVREVPRAAIPATSPAALPGDVASAPQRRAPAVTKPQAPALPQAETTAEPQLTASAPAMSSAPPPPAPAALRSAPAPASAPSLRWILQRRTASGQITDATPETLFAAGDQVTVRVQSPAEGTLAVSTGTGGNLFTTPVSAGQVVVVPSSVNFHNQTEQRISAVLLPPVFPPSSGLTHFRAVEGAVSAEQPVPKPLLESQIILRRK